MTKSILTLILFISSLHINAQIQSVKIVAAGLTCSMCSKAIYKSLTNISNVKNVESDIENSAYIVTFKDTTMVNPDALKSAVTDAGFSVASMKINAIFHNKKISNDSHLLYEGLNLHFINVKEQILNGNIAITITDKDFIDKKSYKKNAAFTKSKCYKTGEKADCCKIENGISNRVYHITLD